MANPGANPLVDIQSWTKIEEIARFVRKMRHGSIVFEITDGRVTVTKIETELRVGKELVRADEGIAKALQV